MQQLHFSETPGFGWRIFVYAVLAAIFGAKGSYKCLLEILDLMGVKGVGTMEAMLPFLK